MRKIVSALLAAAFIAISAVTVMAEEAKHTFEFDKDTCLEKWSMYEVNSDDKATGVTAELSSNEYIAGKAMVIKMDEASSVSGYIGYCMKASDFGLASFDGCVINFNVAFASEYTTDDNVSLFYDGGTWKETPIAKQASTWSQYNFEIPLNSSADVAGILLPVMSGYVGDVVYIDNVKINLPDGTAIENIGDSYEEVVIEKKDEAAQTTSKALFVIIVVIVAFALIGGTAYFFYNLMKKYR